MIVTKQNISVIVITALLFQGGVMAQDQISNGNNGNFFGLYTGPNENVVINNEPFFTGGSNNFPNGQYNFVGGSQNTLSPNGNLINSLAYGENNNLSSPNDGLAIGLGGELDLNDAFTYALGEQITINSGTSVGIGAQHSIAEETSVALGTGHDLSNESNYGFGEGLGVSADEAMAIGFGDGSAGTRLTNNIANSITMGVEANNMLNLFIDNNTNDPTVGINRSSVFTPGATPNVDLTVEGEAEKNTPGNNSWITPSDKRLKKNIRPFQDGLNTLMQIEPKRFELNDKYGEREGKEGIGVIAQEIREVAPYMVYGEEEKDGYLSYSANALWYILVNAVQEQQNQIQTQKTQKESLKNKVEKQEEQINQLRQDLNQLADQVNGNANRFGKSENLNKRTVSINENDKTKEAMLLQNRPNPYSGETVIPYYLPKDFDNAKLLITNTNGQVIKRITLEQAGKSELTLRTEGLKSGKYLYSLIMDGHKIQTRKMVLSKR